MTVNEALKEGKSFIIYPDGSITQIEPEPGHTRLTLEQCQTAVGGYIEQIPINVKPRSWKMFVDEEARFKSDAQINDTASRLDIHYRTRRILGPALVTRHV